VKLSPKQLEIWKQQRVAKANKVGSEWIFFKEGDDDLRDPWSALVIRVEAVLVPGELFRCRCLQPHMVPAGTSDLMTVGTREILYSELW